MGIFGTLVAEASQTLSEMEENPEEEPEPPVIVPEVPVSVEELSLHVMEPALQHQQNVKARVIQTIHLNLPERIKLEELTAQV
eukprot:2529385-Pyramimonas_sp.AAC.1